MPNTSSGTVEDHAPAGHARHIPGFRRFWLSQALSQAGTVMRLLALPLTAILVLDASPFQVGLLLAAAALPPVLFSPLAGASITGNRQRPVLIVSNWLRAIVIGAVPAAYFLGALEMWMLYAAAAGMGTLTLLYEAAYRSYLPSMFEQEEDLDRAEGMVEGGRALATVTGPGIAGAIIYVASAPAALLVDAAGFVLSALSLQTAGKREESDFPADTAGLPGGSEINYEGVPGDAHRVATSGEQSTRSTLPGEPGTAHSLHPYRESATSPAHEAEEAELNEQPVTEPTGGIKNLLSDSALRPLLMAAVTIGFFNAVIESVVLLYMTANLDLDALLVGLVFSATGAGLLLGASMADRLVSAMGAGLALLISTAVIALGDLALPLAEGSVVPVVMVLAAGQVGFAIGLTVYRVAQVDLIHRMTGAPLQGHVLGAFRFAVAASIPLGAIAGGLIGETAGLRETLFIGVAGEGVAVLWLLLSPVWLVKGTRETAGQGPVAEEVEGGTIPPGPALKSH